MASTCKSVTGCIETLAIPIPVRATYVNLYKWPESDAEFVRSLAVTKTHARDGSHYEFDTEYSHNESRRQQHGSRPALVDSYSCRQIYLRSYTFSKKETVPEKTVKCFGRVKDKVSVFPFLYQSDHENTDSIISSNTGSRKYKKKKKKREKNTNTKTKNKKEGCVIAKRLRDASCDLVSIIFHRLLACTASVDVMDR